MQKQPNSLHCFVCGLENPVGLHLKFYKTAPGEILAEVVIPKQYQGYPGVVHGGIVAAILDETGGRAFMDDPMQPRFMFTARLEVRYRKNVPVGVTLRVIGRAGRNKGRTAQATSAIYSPDGEILAEADMLLVDVPEGSFDNSSLEALGWKVYPD